MILKTSIQEVLDRVDVVDVIGQFVQLKRRGNNYIANCPFHNEKTPSFNVNPAKGIYKCFGCGKGGDAVSFIEEYEKFSFVEAIRWLANFYQIELEETEDSEEVKVHKHVEESLRIINDFAADYFHQNLFDGGEGSVIGGQYFQERGFGKQVIEEFQLGYCLDEWDAFSQLALKNGFNAELLQKAGLVKQRDGRLLDNYKGRIIFPIFSNTGKILGFGARIIKKNVNAPKYINTPENELYVKNKVLYGLYQARKSISEAQECFLVEGYADVIALHQGGVKNVVASSGTSLTEGQLKLIGNLTKNLTILYDSDAAGIKAAIRGMDMALADSFRVKLVLLPEGHDPDSFIKEKGSAAFQEYVESHKEDFIEFLLRRGLQGAENDPVKKAQLVNEIAEIISKINKAEDFTIQDYYIKKSATALDVEEEGFFTLVNKFIKERIQNEARQKEREKRIAADAEIEENITTVLDDIENKGQTQTANTLLQQEALEEWQLLKILMENGPKPFEDKIVAYFFFENINPEDFSNPVAQKMALAYRDYWMEFQELPEISFFVNHADREIRQKTADLLVENYVPSTSWTELYKIEVPHGAELYQADFKSTFAYYQLKLVRKLLAENYKQMSKEKDPEQMELLIKTHLKMKEEEKKLLSIVIIK